MFELISGNRKVKLSKHLSGKVNSETLKNVATVERVDEKVVLLHNSNEYNHRYLNMRTATIANKPILVVLLEYSKEIAPNSYEITVGNAKKEKSYNIKDGVLFQIFYRNNWYSIYLGKRAELLKALATLT
ncbi:MAG: hypothetical protein GQ570_14120 [Helicobacteraceae bacterium]|nr:hypothetical protein [Helicobacteraceae bacterium]